MLTTKSTATKIHGAQLESTLIKLSNADIQIEDLKIQLDDALGAEELVVQLTERTLMLGEVTTVLRTNVSLFLQGYAQKIEEMRITIEDLEALKELGEELEENHVETERAMQDEISTCCSIHQIAHDQHSCCYVDEKDVQLAERQQRIESLEEACQDMERTIGRFRELVIQLERSVTSCSKHGRLIKGDDAVNSICYVRKRRTRKMSRLQ